MTYALYWLSCAHAHDQLCLKRYTATCPALLSMTSDSSMACSFDDARMGWTLKYMPAVSRCVRQHRFADQAWRLHSTVASIYEWGQKQARSHAARSGIMMTRVGMHSGTLCCNMRAMSCDSLTDISSGSMISSSTCSSMSALSNLQQPKHYTSTSTGTLLDQTAWPSCAS